MAVLTLIDAHDAQALREAYGLDAIEGIEGIAGGSVNSNYALLTASGRVFCRLYEEQDHAGAEREASLLGRLAARGVPTPSPLPRTPSCGGGFVHALRGKPVALFPWREGTMRCQASVTAGDAGAVGAALARVHLAGGDEAAPEGRFRAEDLRVRLDRIASSGDLEFAPRVPALRRALDATQARRDLTLPAGLVHGDLFRDNVLWTGDGLSALLDFESACRGTYVFDLTVSVLSWCFGDDLDGRLAAAMCRGYQEVRPLGAEERRGLHAEACFAALRFTITRITDYAMRRDAAGPRTIKDWARFMKRFEKLEALGEEGLRELLAV